MRLLRFQVCQQALREVELPQAAAQPGIDKAGLRTEPALFGQLNRLMHGGMVGDAIEPENLVKTEPQEVLQL